MEVHHRLSGGRPGVEAHVVPVRLELMVELALHLVDQAQQRGALLAGRREPVDNHASCHHQRVPRRHRVPIAERERELVRGDPRPLGHLEEHGHVASIVDRAATMAYTTTGRPEIGQGMGRSRQIPGTPATLPS